MTWAFRGNADDSDSHYTIIRSRESLNAICLRGIDFDLYWAIIQQVNFGEWFFGIYFMLCCEAVFKSKAILVRRLPEWKKRLSCRDKKSIVIFYAEKDSKV